LPQDTLVDVLELARRIDPQFVGQQAPRVLERGKRVCLTA